MTPPKAQPVASEVELWQAQKDGRTLRCIAVYVPLGIDLLMEGADFRRTQLAKTAPEADVISNAWRRKLLEVGWVEHCLTGDSGNSPD